MSVGVVSLRALMIVVVAISVTSCYQSNARIIGDYYAKYEDVQGTEKYTLDATRVDVEDVMLPVNVPYMKIVRSYDDDAYDLLKSHFYTKGQNLNLSIECTISHQLNETKSPYDQASIAGYAANGIAGDPASGMAEIVLSRSVELSATLSAPNKKVLKKYDYNAVIKLTHTYNIHDREHTTGLGMDEQISTLYYNCYGNLINQMVADMEQINEWGYQYESK